MKTLLTHKDKVQAYSKVQIMCDQNLPLQDLDGTIDLTYNAKTNFWQVIKQKLVDMIV